MLNRKRLSEIVFRHPEAKVVLERVTHPRIRQAYYQKRDRYIRENPQAVVQAVIPLLIEAGMQDLFHYIVLVYAPASVQLRRLVRRDQFSEDHAQRIIASQLDIEKKRDEADFIIDNSGNLDATGHQVDALWDRLQALREERA